MSDKNKSSPASSVASVTHGGHLRSSTALTPDMLMNKYDVAAKMLDSLIKNGSFYTVDNEPNALLIDVSDIGLKHTKQSVIESAILELTKCTQEILSLQDESFDEMSSFIGESHPKIGIVFEKSVDQSYITASLIALKEAILNNLNYEAGLANCKPTGRMGIA